MRCALALLLLAALSMAGDAVHLENGRVLHGTVVEETDVEIVIDLGAGRLRIPRGRVLLVERGVQREPPPPTLTRRDEWFLILHRDKVAGWQHFTETENAGRIQVQEETVFFRPGGGDDVSLRRVEVADAGGRPLEFLLVESYGGEAEVTSGHVRGGRTHVRIVRDGRVENRELDPPDEWVLALPAWSRFLEEAREGEVRRLTALDLRLLKPVDLVLRRQEDDAAPGDPRPCRAMTLAGDFRRGRALYRPGEGPVAIELNGPSLVAKRTTRERVDLARKTHAAPAPLTLEEAQRYPFVVRPKKLDVHHARGGVSLRAPDAGWGAETLDADSGRLVCFEKIALFASLEVFVYPASGRLDPDACLERGLARLRLETRELAPLGDAVETRIAGLPARAQRLSARHRGEDLRVLLAAVAAEDRYVLLVGAAPARWWRWAEKDFLAFADSLVIVP